MSGPPKPPALVTTSGPVPSARRAHGMPGATVPPTTIGSSPSTAAAVSPPTMTSVATRRPRRGADLGRRARRPPRSAASLVTAPADRAAVRQRPRRRRSARGTERLDLVRAIGCRLPTTTRPSPPCGATRRTPDDRNRARRPAPAAATLRRGAGEHHVGGGAPHGADRSEVGVGRRVAHGEAAAAAIGQPGAHGLGVGQLEHLRRTGRRAGARRGEPRRGRDGRRRAAAARRRRARHHRRTSARAAAAPATTSTRAPVDPRDGHQLVGPVAAQRRVDLVRRPVRCDRRPTTRPAPRPFRRQVPAAEVDDHGRRRRCGVPRATTGTGPSRSASSPATSSAPVRSSATTSHSSTGPV